MPIYEYECDECGNIEEVLQKFSDDPITTCKKCSGAVHRIVSQSTFHLKGSGWYVTDYASKSGNTSSSPKKSTETASAEKTTTTKKSVDKTT